MRCDHKSTIFDQTTSLWNSKIWFAIEEWTYNLNHYNNHSAYLVEYENFQYS